MSLSWANWEILMCWKFKKDLIRRIQAAGRDGSKRILVLKGSSKKDSFHIKPPHFVLLVSTITKYWIKLYIRLFFYYQHFTAAHQCFSICTLSFPFFYFWRPKLWVIYLYVRTWILNILFDLVWTIRTIILSTLNVFKLVVDRRHFSNSLSTFK